jgi:hypothetical protein
MKKRWRIWLKMFFSIPVVLIFLSVGVVWWLWGGYIRTSIPDDLVPTAEYLMNQPIVEPLSLKVFPKPGTITKSNDRTYVCITYNPQYKDATKLQLTYTWTRIYLNGQRIPQSEISGSTVETIPQGCLEISYDLHLPSGIHLFHIQVNKSFDDFLSPNPSLSYEWAYRVE